MGRRKAVASSWQLSRSPQIVSDGTNLAVNLRHCSLNHYLAEDRWHLIGDGSCALSGLNRRAVISQTEIGVLELEGWGVDTWEFETAFISSQG